MAAGRREIEVPGRRRRELEDAGRRAQPPHVVGAAHRHAFTSFAKQDWLVVVGPTSSSCCRRRRSLHPLQQLPPSPCPRATAVASSCSADLPTFFDFARAEFPAGIVAW
jgi:hypothetical protein